MSTEEYEEYKKRRNSSTTWNYFLTSLDRKTAKCKICSKIIKTHGASTSGLHGHLKTKHGVKVPPVQIRKSTIHAEKETTNSEDTSVLVVMDQDNEYSFESTKSTRILKKDNMRCSASFEEYSKRQNSSSIWIHFLRSVDRQSAKCKICSKVLKTNGASTSSLHSHLKSKHKIDVINKSAKRRPFNRLKVKKENNSDLQLSIVKQEGEQCFDETELGPVYNEIDITQETFNESSYSLENSGQKVNTPIAIISRMVALDGLPISSVCDSLDFCNLLSQSGYDVPSSDIETLGLILEQSDSVKLEIANELKQFKSLGLKFCLNFEQYITLHNKTYVSINVYNEDTKFGDPKNLGLLKITNNMEGDEILKIISERLQTFDLSLYDDIIAFTCGNSVAQIKVGLDLDYQLCFGQAVQRGVLEILYKQEDSEIIYHDTDDSDCDSDTENGAHDRKNAFFVKIPDVPLEPQLIYKDIIDKVRKLVRYYKNSSTRNEILQNNVRKKYDKEILLVLDCKKRWSSLCEMIGRFLKLKDCIHESLTYLEMDLFINDDELQVLQEIHDSLVVIKATITALCKPNGNLLTADAALRFMIRKLEAQNNAISRNFALAIRENIKRSRTIMSSVIQYLHDRHTYNKYSEDDTFLKHTSEEIIDKILKLLTRMKPLIEDKLNSFEYKSKTDRNILDPLESEDDEEMSIEKQLENEIKTTCHSETPKAKLLPQELDLKKIIMGEVSIYESTGGTRGLYLTMAYDLLLSVMPTTAEADHFFFSWKDAHKRLSCHPEVLLNSLFMLRAYFKEQRRLEMV